MYLLNSSFLFFKIGDCSEVIKSKA